mmetsp:Transcript_29837/g.68460  ORF Transcript_29837/g.68460 Transcript_29837/m.68460 type:complete len:87 (-) Transcript_29837:381-641(-)
MKAPHSLPNISSKEGEVFCVSVPKKSDDALSTNRNVDSIGWTCNCNTGLSRYLPPGILGKAVGSALSILQVSSSAGGCYHNPREPK